MANQPEGGRTGSRILHVCLDRTRVLESNWPRCEKERTLRFLPKVSCQATFHLDINITVYSSYKPKKVAFGSYGTSRDMNSQKVNDLMVKSSASLLPGPGSYENDQDSAFVTAKTKE